MQQQIVRYRSTAVAASAGAAAAAAAAATTVPSTYASSEKDVDLEEEYVAEDSDGDVDVKRADVRQIPVAPAAVLASGGGGGGGGNGKDDPSKLDRISLLALSKNPHAVLFHRIYPFKTSDNRTLDYLATMTLKRAEICSTPTIKDVRDYLVLAIALQTSLDRQHSDTMFKGVLLSRVPKFRMTRYISTPYLMVDILYWLGVLGTDSVWMMLDHLTMRLTEVFKIPAEQSPLFEVKEKLTEPTSKAGRALASIAFSVMASDVASRWGEKWASSYVFKYDDVNYPEASTQAHRLKFEYIMALQALMSAIMQVAAWISDKDKRKNNSKMNYSMVDVSALNICINDIQKATSLIKDLENTHTLGVELFHTQLLDLVAKLRVFAIASEISTRPAERRYAIWYIVRVPQGWFPKLERTIFEGLSEETITQQTEGKEPPLMAKRFAYESHAHKGAFDLVRLPPNPWPRMQLVVTTYDTRVAGGMGLVPKSQKKPKPDS